MPLVFGLNLYRLKPIHPTNCCGRVHKFLGVFQRNTIAGVDLHTPKRDKLVNGNSFLDAEGLVFGVDSTGGDPECPLNLCPRLDWLAGQGGNIPVIINNPPRDDGAV